MSAFISKFWHDNSGQDIAEYAVVVAAMLVAVFTAAHVVGLKAHTVFAEVARLLQ